MLTVYWKNPANDYRGTLVEKTEYYESGDRGAVSPVEWSTLDGGALRIKFRDNSGVVYGPNAWIKMELE